MEINLEKNINLEKEKNNFLNQEKFLESNFGKILNFGLDYGLRKILPNIIEEEVINLKDNILKSGIKEGINKTIKDLLKEGKETLKIIKGDFKDITQVKTILNTRDILNSISNLLDNSINFATKRDLINQNVGKLIKNEKSIILNNIEKNIEKMYKNQFEAIENFDLLVKNWKNAFERNDIKLMEKNYKKIKGIYKSIMPLEKIINTSKKIEDIHTKIRNNNNIINLKEQDLNLINLLN